jgi:hypothetical protein
MNCIEHDQKCSSSEFVNLLRSPGIDAKPGGPVGKPYFTFRPSRLQHRMAESIPWNRFLGSLHVYKYGLRDEMTENENREMLTEPRRVRSGSEEGEEGGGGGGGKLDRLFQLSQS